MRPAAIKLICSTWAVLGSFAIFFAHREATASPKNKASVLLFLSTDCPVAMQYTPRLKRLHEEFAVKGVEFKAYFSNDLETSAGIRAYAKERNYRFPCELDLTATKAKSYQIKIIPTAVVTDSSGKVIYKGAIDDHKDPILTRKPFVSDVLKSYLSNQPIPYAESEPFGCVLMPAEPLPPAKSVTYAEHIKPILDRSCVKCHQPGQVAPFSLVGYENAKKWAPMIEITSKSRKMPPWKAVEGYGQFKDANTLSETEIELLSRWNAAGASRGPTNKEPKDPPMIGKGWAMGEPDFVVQPSESYDLAAEGQDDYRHFVIKTNFSETKYIKAMDVKPGNTKVVHHVIAFLDERGQSHRLDRKDGKPGYSTFGGVGFVPSGSLGGWAPGLQPQKLPQGVAFELKPGTTLVMQVHYHRSGKAETDLTKIGLYFAEEKVDKAMGLAWLANPLLNIPAGADKHVVRQVAAVPADITLYSLMPHMHLLGRSMRAEVEYPGGEREALILVDDWDFNWQFNYSLLTPKKIPGGSKIHVEAVYDNSEKNPLNPSSPPKPVRWGEETTDEMMLLIAAYTVDGGMRPARGWMFSRPEVSDKRPD